MVKFTINLPKSTLEWLIQWGRDHGMTPRKAAREIIELLHDSYRPVPKQVPPTERGGDGD